MTYQQPYIQGDSRDFMEVIPHIILDKKCKYNNEIKFIIKELRLIEKAKQNFYSRISLTKMDIILRKQTIVSFCTIQSGFKSSFQRFLPASQDKGSHEYEPCELHFVTSHARSLLMLQHRECVESTLLVFAQVTYHSLHLFKLFDRVSCANKSSALYTMACFENLL